jgi:dihydroflavonol-4-reductase
MNGVIVVTGASGHIGNVVCRLLLDKGYRVRALYMSSKESLAGLPVDFFRCDILNPGDLDELMQDSDAVIHCAAQISIHGDPDGMVFKTNVEGTRNVLKAAQINRVRRLIHISSVHAVEELPHDVPFDESRPYKTNSAPAYEYSKAVAEQLVLEAGKQGAMEVVILRPGSVLGAFDFKPSEIGKALLDFYQEKIPALPPGGYDFADVRDVARTIVNAVEKGRNCEVYNITGKYHSMHAFARLIHEVTGKKVPSVVLPYSFLRFCLPFISLYGRITGTPPLFTRQSIDVLKHGHPAMDHSKASDELGHSCRPLSESLRDFYNWNKGETVQL